jgi:hypothetical protein
MPGYGNNRIGSGGIFGPARSSGWGVHRGSGLPRADVHYSGSRNSDKAWDGGERMNASADVDDGRRQHLKGHHMWLTRTIVMIDLIIAVILCASIVLLDHCGLWFP